MSPLFFIHIPKTAGTSFREAAIKQWGHKKVLSDYGSSNHSSAIVKELVHTDKDYFKFSEYLSNQSIRMLSGHAPVRYYRRIFAANRLVTFVRNPVDRVISHYRTACQFQGFQGSLEDFYTDPENINVQSRYLAQMPIELFGFIGLTEHFAESVQLFNQQYNQKFQQLVLNRQKAENVTLEKPANTNKQSHTGPSVSAEQRREIGTHNAEDVALYAAAEQLFQARLGCSQQKSEYSFAKVQSLDTARIQGWAVGLDESQPRRLEIQVNDNAIAVKTAKEYLPAMKERNAGRQGYIGFIHAFHPPLSATDSVVVRDMDNDLILRGPQKPRQPLTNSETAAVGSALASKATH